MATNDNFNSATGRFCSHISTTLQPGVYYVTVGASVTMVRIAAALRPYGMQTEVQPEIGNATAGSVALAATGA